jgi:hypothetical protein
MAKVNGVVHIAVDGSGDSRQRAGYFTERQKEIYTSDLGTRHVARWTVHLGSVAAPVCPVPLDPALPEKLQRPVFTSQRRVEVFLLTTEGQEVAVALPLGVRK